LALPAARQVSYRIETFDRGIRIVASSSSDKDAYPSEWWGGQSGAVAAGRATEDSSQESVNAVAQYLADMTGQLESMAMAAKLDLVAYLLAMARSEADSIARTHPGAGGRR
jgi:hypothetical protein